MKTKQPIWARTLIEAGKTAVFLASFLLFWTFVQGAINFQPGALLVLGLLATLGVILLIDEYRRWRNRDHT